MTEIDPQIPTTEQVSQWLEHDQQLFKDGAVIDKLGNLSITADQYDTLSTQAPEQLKDQIVHTESQSDAGEQLNVMTPERLKEILDDSIYAAKPYMRGACEMTYSVFGENDPNKSRYVKNLLNITSKNGPGLSKEGVSEVVTTMPYDQYSTHYGKYSLEGSKIKWPGEDESEREAVYVVEYGTITGAGKDGAKYVYEDHVGRSNSYNYAILLPESAAKELEAAMKADPNLARQLGDELVNNTGGRNARSDITGNTHNWDQHKPDHDKWREANGGVDRMAFANQYEQPLEKMEIVEY